MRKCSKIRNEKGDIRTDLEEMNNYKVMLVVTSYP